MSKRQIVEVFRHLILQPFLHIHTKIHISVHSHICSVFLHLFQPMHNSQGFYMNKTSHSPHALHVCSWAHWHTSRGPEKTAAKANGGKVIVDTNSFTGGKHHYTPLMPPFVGYFMVCSCICKVFVGYFHVFSVATFDDEGIQQTATEVQAILFGFHRIPPSVAASSVQDGAERAWHGLSQNGEYRWPF